MIHGTLRTVLATLMVCSLVQSATACINDSETRGSESRFTSSYGNPSLATREGSASPNTLTITRSQVQAVGLVGSLFGCALLGAGLYTAIARQRTVNAARIEAEAFRSMQEGADSALIKFLD